LGSSSALADIRVRDHVIVAGDHTTTFPERNCHDPGKFSMQVSNPRYVDAS
jgi:hypothetical protein